MISGHPPSPSLVAAPPPPPPPTTATNIVMQPLVASTVTLANGVDKRKFSDVLKHQFDSVNLQVEHGLMHVKRTCTFVETILKVLEHSSDAARLTQDLMMKWKDEPLQDVHAQYVYAGGMIGEVMIHTYTAFEKFRKSAQADCVSPLYAFYKSAQARRRELTKDHARMLATWTSVEESLGKERRDCAKSYTELRLCQDAKDREEISETAQKDLYPKLVKKWKAQKEVCVKKFQLFEKSYEKSQALQVSNDTVSLPAMLAELESIERDRLHHLTDYMTKFQQLFLTWSSELKSSSDLINKVVPALQAEKAMSSMLDKFCASFGPPPAMIPIRYDLPCTSASILSDQLPSDAQPVMAYLPGSTGAQIAPAPSSSSMGSGSFPSRTISSAPTFGQGSSPVPPGSTSTNTPPRTVPGAASGPPGTQQQIPQTGRTTPIPLPKAAMPVAVVRPLPVVGNPHAAVHAASSTPTANATAPPPPPPPASATATVPPTAPAAPSPPPLPVAVTASATAAVPPAIPTASATAAPGPPASSAPPSITPAAAPVAPKATPATSLGVFKGGSSRAPPPSLPQKRKPKAAGDGLDVDPSALPPPPLPPTPVQVESRGYRASISHPRASVSQPHGPRASVVAHQSLVPRASVIRASVSQAQTVVPPPVKSSPPPLPVQVQFHVQQPATTEVAAPAAASESTDTVPSLAVPPLAPSTGRLSIFGVSLDSLSSGGGQRLSTSSRGPPPLPAGGGRTSVSGPPPLPGGSTEVASQPMAAEPATIESPTEPDSITSDRSYESPAAEAVDSDSQPVQYAVAMYDFALNEDTADIHYISFSAGDQVTVFNVDDDWWYGEVQRPDGTTDTGFFAGAYVSLIDPNEQTNANAADQ